MKNNIASAVITAATLTLAQFAAGATTAFYYTPGAAGSYVAQGTGLITSGQDGWAFSVPIKANENSFTMNMIQGNYEGWWFIDISTPKGQPFTTGIYAANRWPFQPAGKAGFTWYGDGRGLNTLTAYFEILDFYFNPNTNTVERLAFNAIQFEETWNVENQDYNQDHCSYLSYSFGSDVSISKTPSSALLAMTVPEPSCSVLAVLGACSLIKRRR